ncbi:MAG: hypothetical protein ORO03_07490, partial [Alphaproteobacteria bacterium]|nr:hypothetical protein [Alphaproteobacteria bacterium]
SVATTRDGLRLSVKRLQERQSCQVLCEQFIVGREVRTAAIKGPGQDIYFLGASECHFGRAKPGWGFKTERMRSSNAPERDFGASSQRMPLSGSITKRLPELTLDYLNALDIRGPATVDLRVSHEGEIFVVEVNANPGLSPFSQTWGGRRFRSNLLRIVAEGLSR